MPETPLPSASDEQEPCADCGCEALRHPVFHPSQPADAEFCECGRCEGYRPSSPLEWFIRRLEIDGYRALPCRTCKRDGAIGVNKLYELLRAITER